MIGPIIIAWAMYPAVTRRVGIIEGTGVDAAEPFDLV